MKELLAGISVFIIIILLGWLAQWSFDKISSPSDFLVVLGVLGLILIVVIVYFTIVILKKFLSR